MDAAQLIAQIASQGLLGILLIIVSWAYWKKDQELREERGARIADAKSYNELSLKLQAQVLDAVNKLADILEEIKKVMSPRSTGGGAGR